MSEQPITELKEQTWEEFFEGRTINGSNMWERAYHAFNARREAEENPPCNWCIQHPDKNIPFSCNGKRCGKIKVTIAEEKLAEAYKPHYCRCPYPYETTRDNGICRYLGDTDVCTHPSNKPPEPSGCRHRKKELSSNRYGYRWVSYKNYGDKHCRDCGKKLKDED